MTVDIHDPQDVERHLWEEMQVHPIGMLMLVGGRACAKGSLGSRFEPTDLMPYALAHALWMEKFGA